MNDLDNERLNQLRKYAQWERENGPAGKLHILDWAASEIEGLTKQLEQARVTLKFASARFAGIRMYTKDGKIAAACADGETRTKQALKQQEVGNE